MTERRWIYDIHGRGQQLPDTSGMLIPVSCCHCGEVYDLAGVTVLQRYADCSLWRCPGCSREVDDRTGKSLRDYVTVEELSRRRRA